MLTPILTGIILDVVYRMYGERKEIVRILDTYCIDFVLVSNAGINRRVQQLAWMDDSRNRGNRIRCRWSISNDERII